MTANPLRSVDELNKSNDPRGDATFHPDEGVTFHVDLRNTHYIDSSALGMMLLLREYAKCRGGSVIIDSPSEQIDKLLKVANFEQLFVIN